MAPRVAPNATSAPNTSGLDEIFHILAKFVIAMELAEVVNPQFAFPVVGVVLCAVLVFALGFKSPVQPPSFDFDDDKPKSKKQLKRAKVISV